jgi:hypothetical protein
MTELNEINEKERLTINHIKALEPYVSLKGDKFEVIEPKGNLLRVIDKDVESCFHFTIEKYQKNNNGIFQFLMTRIPKNVYDNSVYQI